MMTRRGAWLILHVRQLQVRNVILAVVNGGITLVILLIAPLGLAAVIINTLLVAGATWLTATVMDGVCFWLMPQTLPRPSHSQQPVSSAIEPISESIRRPDA
ncbi:MAG: CRISPR-associated protein Csx18 [Gloeomargarita sp. SKYG116]|nr:CRISPR-associated protein Csx18 [Gloeomargarita sp. SKYG116]MDW8402169.1 CRISPR-associated protein Csx18 [Gloeomargarita sp. SKYGB_i_bin116]